MFSCAALGFPVPPTPRKEGGGTEAKSLRFHSGFAGGFVVVAAISDRRFVLRDRWGSNGFEFEWCLFFLGSDGRGV